MTALLAGLWMIAAALALEPLRCFARFVHQRSRRPKVAVRRFAELPDFMELLALSLSCGHPLTSAWPTAARFMPAGPLRRELERASAALLQGRPVDRCMSELSDRIGDGRAAMAFALIAQAFVMGNAVEACLLSQAASLRRLRLTDVEKRAQTAPLRMMIPVLLLIFPAVMIILLGPIVLGLMKGGMF